jgi:hypothetical protein
MPQSSRVMVTLAASRSQRVASAFFAVSEAAVSEAAVSEASKQAAVARMKTKTSLFMDAPA